MFKKEPSKNIKYFISYTFTKESDPSSTLGIGNGYAETELELDSMDLIIEMQNGIAMKENFKNVVIINWIRLK